MKKILVIVHIYYPEMWEELKECLGNIENQYDLYVTTVEANRELKSDILNFNPRAHFEVVENRGYDIGPFIHVINRINLDKYSYVVKLHTKRDFDLKNYGFRNLNGSKWRKELLSFIKTPKDFSKCLELFKSNPKIGMINSIKIIVPDNMYDKDAIKLTKIWLKQHMFSVKHFNFVAGSMFIVRASLLENIKELNVSLHDFPESCQERKAQLAHVIERLFGYFVEINGFVISDPYLTFDEQNKIKKGYCLLEKKIRLLEKMKRFFFQKKRTKKGKLIVKVCKIPMPVKFLSKLVKIKEKEGKKKIFLFGIHVFSLKTKISNKDVIKLIDWMDDLHNNKEHFVPIAQKKYERKESDVKVFAFYLPQFHAIPENDKAHGKGFTEWTNVASCRPYFVGHFQPKIPYDIGFYNLLQPGIIERQCEIAKTYGIYGFCFYYYWFSGRKVLEKPLEYFLNSDIDFHFHFCWANENWSKLWDGGDKEIILEQKLEDNDAEKFFFDILPFIKDYRYEKINNKPLLMIYRPTLFDKVKFLSFVDKLNQLAINTGFDGFYLMASNMNDFNDPKSWNMEGIIEFPPHGIGKYCPIFPVNKISGQASFNVLDIRPYIDQKKYLKNSSYNTFKSCFPSWDNLPRKAFSGGTCFKMEPEDFEQWLSDILLYTSQKKAEEQYVYINAWNEWAEGAVLEPTTRYGYKYLEIVRNCIKNTHKRKKDATV